MAEFQHNLWAPWRMEYIDSLGGPKQDTCFLCDAREHPEADAGNLVLWRGAQTLVLLNRFPYASGHTLIAPLAHVGDLDMLDDATLLDLVQWTRRVRRVLEAGLRAEGFNIGINLGRCAGAGLPGHLHIHVVPRWSGDTNFMPVLGNARVMPQALEATRAAILRASDQVDFRS